MKLRLYLDTEEDGYLGFCWYRETRTFQIGILYWRIDIEFQK